MFMECLLPAEPGTETLVSFNLMKAPWGRYQDSPYFAGGGNWGIKNYSDLPKVAQLQNDRAGV